MNVTQELRYRFGLSRRISPYAWMLRMMVRRLIRPLCLFRMHKFWDRESELVALASGNSSRCQFCNHIVLKREFRPSLRDVLRWIMEYISGAYEGGPDD